jgi:DNA invertase Pin-like site-specific DNA recombinase
MDSFTFFIVAVGILVFFAAVLAMSIALVRANGRDEDVPRPPIHRPAPAPAYSVTKTVTKKAGRPRASEPDAEALKKLYAKHGNIRGVAAELGFGTTKAWRALNRAGVALDQSRRQLPLEKRRQIQEALAAGDRSQRSVAAEFGVTHSTVSRIAKEELP